MTHIHKQRECTFSFGPYFVITFPSSIIRLRRCSCRLKKRARVIIVNIHKQYLHILRHLCSACCVSRIPLRMFIHFIITLCICVVSFLCVVVIISSPIKNLKFNARWHKEKTSSLLVSSRSRCYCLFCIIVSSCHPHSSLALAPTRYATSAALNARDTDEVL